MKHPKAARRWRFSITIWDEDEIYLDENGKPDDEYETEVFIGNDSEASAECERRTLLYENANEDEWVSESTVHALGLVDPSLYLVPET